MVAVSAAAFIQTRLDIRSCTMYYELSRWRIYDAVGWSVVSPAAAPQPTTPLPLHTNTLPWSAVDRVLVTKLCIMYVSKCQD